MMTGDDEDELEESDNGQGDNSDGQNDDDADEKNDFNNFGDQKQMMKKI